MSLVFTFDVLTLFFVLQNVMENYPQFIVLLTLASVKRPTLAAAAGALRLLGFVLYVKGYRV